MKRESRLPASPTAYRHHGARAGGARRRRRRPSVGDVPSILGRPFFRGRAVSALGHDLGQTNEHENKARRGAGGKRTSKINDLCRGWQPARRGTTVERAGPTAPTGRGRVGAPGAPQSTARPVMVNGTHRLRLQFMLGFSAHSPLKSCGASLRHFGTVYRYGSWGNSIPLGQACPAGTTLSCWDNSVPGTNESCFLRHPCPKSCS